MMTDVGQVRSGNEDSVLCEPLESLAVAERGLFCAVADGMGGHASGEDASSLAVKVARDAFYGSSSGADPLETLRVAVAQANAAVYEAGAGKTGRDHMGTTLTAAVLLNGRVVVGHVGDSRCYLVQSGGIRQLSRDHSWVAEEVEAGRMTREQARVNPRRNIITRALGLRPDVDVDASEAVLAPGSVLVICSDGLHGLVSEDEIVSHVRRLRPADAVDALVQLANQRGGPDNITVVVARVMGDDEGDADTERGIPVLSEALMATSRADLSELSDPAEPPAQPAAVVPPPLVDDAAEAATTPDMDETPGRAPGERLADEHLVDEQPEHGLGHDHDPPTPRAPVPEQMLARAAQPERRAGRSGGVVLLTVLVLLIVLGAAVGYLLFHLAGFVG